MIEFQTYERRLDERHCIGQVDPKQLDIQKEKKKKKKLEPRGITQKLMWIWEAFRLLLHQITIFCWGEKQMGMYGQGRVERKAHIYGVANYIFIVDVDSKFK